MFNDKEDKIKALATRMGMLLQKHLLEEAPSAEIYMTEVQEIRKAILQYGYHVQWNSEWNPTTHGLQVEVRVLKPKEIMNAEEAALYDKWFLEANR